MTKRKSLNMLRYLLAIGWSIGVLTGVPGCQPAAHPDAEEHEHFPPHWPESIFQASKRLSEFVERTDPTSSTHRIPPHQELIDLVGWLPILAADSELDRATFDRIDAASARIMARWQRTPPPQDPKALVSEPDVQEMIAWLTEVCRQEQARIDQLGP
ncbi:MAG: hypothetical protein ACK553_05675 [Planctomycetota bacterium]|jgi:hypothetical protein